LNGKSPNTQISSNERKVEPIALPDQSEVVPFPGYKFGDRFVCHDF